MRRKSWEWGSKKCMIEQAKEELEILESQHPNRFHYLKLDLKTLIADFESDQIPLPNDDSILSFSTSPSVVTQESSSCRKKRKRDGFVTEADDTFGAHGFVKKKDETDGILERAQECLHKIQKFKKSAYSNGFFDKKSIL